jgi:hypothetical protein
MLFYVDDIICKVGGVDMKPFHKISFISLAVFVIVVLAGYAPAGPVEYVMQEWAADTREDCLENCRQRFEGYGRRGRRGKSHRFRARMYARCVAKCERQFWKEWDRQMKDVE